MVGSSEVKLSPDVVRGRVLRWLQVGGVLLLGGEPTVNTTVRGLALPTARPHDPAGAEGGTHKHTKTRTHTHTNTTQGSQTQAKTQGDITHTKSQSKRPMQSTSCAEAFRRGNILNDI